MILLAPVVAGFGVENKNNFHVSEVVNVRLLFYDEFE